MTIDAAAAIDGAAAATDALFLSGSHPTTITSLVLRMEIDVFLV